MSRMHYFHPVVVFFFCHPLLAATPEPSQVPIEAKLVHALQAGRVKIGDPVLAKVQVKWDGIDCSLREGAIIRGRIIAQTPRSKTNKTSDIALLFDGAECQGYEMKALPLTLAALVARDPTRDPYETMPLMSSLGAIQHGAMDRNSFGHDRFTAGQVAATRVAGPMRHKSPEAVKPGDVLGIDGVKLSVAGGPEGSSVLSSSRHNLYLETATQIVLVASAKPSADAPSPTTKVLDPKPSEPEPIVDETEICMPPACNIALADESGATARSKITVPIKNLGYPAPPTREMVHFDHEAAIAYLGENQLLFTFNPHTLVPRPGMESDARTVRMVRGALIDLATMKVKKIVDWRVPDEDQYLWPVGNHSVLIHAGRELKLYGPGLKLEQSLVLDGRLAFMRSSPSGAYIAIGVTHERHSEEVHRQLREAEGEEPEEDVNVRVVDSAFKVAIDVNRSSRALPPVLLEDGEVQALNSGGTRWRLVDTNWKGEQRILARLTSACRPLLSSLPPSLLFVVGCNVEEFGRWYRVVGIDGRAVLKGKSASDELEQSASGSISGAAVAIGVARVSKPRSANETFHASDLKSQFVAVYGADNGKRLLGVNVTSPLPTHQTFALSGDASQLAVLEGDHIALYDLPGASRVRH